MSLGRQSSLILLGLVLLLQPAIGAEDKPAEQKKLFDEAKQIDAQVKKLSQAGQSTQAIPLCEKALEIRKEALGQRHRDVASTLHTLATLYYDVGQYTRAERLYQETLAIRKEVLGPRHQDVARSLNNLANLYKDMGQYAKAEGLYHETLAIYRQVLGPRHPEMARSLNNLANLYREMGLYTKAEPLHQEALAIRKEALEARHPDIAQSLNNLAALYADMGLYAKAEPLQQEALAIKREALGPRHPSVALSLNNLAALYADMGLYAKAEPLYQEALVIYKQALGPRHPEMARSLNNLAEMYRDMGQYRKAEPLFQEALAIRQEALGPRHRDVADSLNNLAEVLRDMGQYGKAKPLFQEGLAIRKEVLGSRHPYMAEALHSLAEMYRDMGQYRKAEPLYQEALAIRKEALGSRHPAVDKSVLGLALLYLAMGQPQVAMPLLKQGTDSSEQLLRTMFTESRLSSILEQQRAAEEIVYSVLAQGKGGPAADRLALSLALLRKGRSAEEGIQTQRAIQQILKDPQDRSLFDRLTSVLSQLASLYLRDPSEVPSYQKLVASLESEADSIEQKLAQHSSAFRTLQLPGPDEVLARVANVLPQNGALIEWIALKSRNFSAKGREPQWGLPHYLALVLFPDQHIRVVDLGEARPIDDAIQALQDQLSQPRSNFLPVAQNLHRLVMVPLQQVLEGRTNLFVSPDGALNLVPLWALHDGKQFLLDSYRITYLTSGRDLLRPPAAAPQALSMTVLADPDFRPASAKGAPIVAQAALSRAAFFQQLQHVQPLPGTKAEALAIQKMFPQARLLMGRDATEKALRSLQAPTVLHIATHGVFWDDRSVPLYEPAYEPARTLKIVAGPPAAAVPAKDKPAPANPLARSALLLAGVEALGQQAQPPPDENDGLMTALEVSGLNLWGTQLVVLSACDTGRGAVQIGQGVYGLRRAFFNAGAETLVTSLWQVSDQATQELMGSYYRNLLAGQGRVEAMRQAALAVRTKHPHPYYWAPFIVLGRGDPLRGLPARH